LLEVGKRCQELQASVSARTAKLQLLEYPAHRARQEK
jgi:hypothetical protein